MRFSFLMVGLLLTLFAFAQEPAKWQGKFEQLDQALPTPNEYRSASGAPGPKYWQQKADYVITVELNDVNQTITGSEKITYHNNSPDVLTYLWLQLDQNIFDLESNTAKTSGSALRDSLSAKQAAGQLNLYGFDGGFKIKSVKDVSGKALAYTINKTMMRVDLPQPLKTSGEYSFAIEWSYLINDRSTLGGRSGYEFFPEDARLPDGQGNYVYTIAQFFPRMCVYDDVVGWQNKQFLGRGEFALAFGDYNVSITAPADHIIAATGMIKNAAHVLTKTELERFEKAKSTFDKPVIIVTQDEAVKKEKTKSTEKRTWQFVANNVRDFAFASSRKFIWDAMAVKINSNTPLAMSYYSKEGNPLWEKESTLAVKNTLEVYSKYTIDYPYPQATSVHGASIGMEYPMICFNFGRPGKDGNVTPQLRQGMIGVVVHEVGHNFFPMIINSDERQMTWMDEGLDSFVQLLTELERYPDIDWSRGRPAGIVPYMKGDKNLMRPLMTNSEQVIQFGPEQYAKAATALFILRETVMGKELFDKAFKEYAQRWAFKHPKPADFFRTMEDASAVDLDWFWKGWFYTTDNNDQSIDQVKWFRLRTDEKNVENKNVTAKKGDLTTGNSDKKNFTDFSGGPQPFSVIATDDRLYGEFRSRIDDKAVMGKLQDKNIYEVKLSNKGGLVMPVVIEWTFKDGTKETDRIPAEIWRTNETTATKVFVKEKEVVSIVLDPQKETADVSLDDNVFPRTNAPSQFDTFKKKN